MFMPNLYFGFAFITALPSAMAATVVELRADVEVSGQVYLLSDIARVSGDNAQQLEQVKIGRVPRPGSVEHLSQAQISRVIESTAPRWRGHWQWSGSNAVNIRSMGIALDGQGVLNMAQDFLYSELSSYEKVQIKPVDGIREMKLPAAAQLRPRPLNGKVAHRMVVWIDIEADGRPYGSIPVWFSINAWKKVPVARIDLPVGSEIKADDFVFEQRDVAANTKILETLPFPNGMRLRTPLTRGATIATNMLEVVPAISRNQQVAVKVNAGNIVIETSGIAQGDAHVGGTVKIKNSNDSGAFLATVVEAGVVSVNAR